MQNQKMKSSYYLAGIMPILYALCVIFLPLYSQLPIDNWDTFAVDRRIPDESERVKSILFEILLRRETDGYLIMSLPALMLLAGILVLYIRSVKALQFAEIVSLLSVLLTLLIGFFVSVQSYVAQSIYLQFGSMPDPKLKLEYGYLPALLFAVVAFIAAARARRSMMQQHVTAENTDDEGA